MELGGDECGGGVVGATGGREEGCDRCLTPHRMGCAFLFFPALRLCLFISAIRNATTSQAWGGELCGGGAYWREVRSRESGSSRLMVC